jgi:transcriptional regulator with XRE-family HTH domain
MDAYTNQITHVNSGLNTLGARLRELRVLYGDSQVELGEIIGCTRQAVSQHEHDQMQPSLHKLMLIARRYQTSLNWIITGEGIPPTLPARAHRRRRLPLSLSPSRMAATFTAYSNEEQDDFPRTVGVANVWNSIERVIA